MRTTVPCLGNSTHVLENSGAGDVELSGEELWRLDREFREPNVKTPLDIE